VTTFEVVLHFLMENQNNVAQVKDTLKTAGFDISFVYESKETLQISGNRFEIVMLEPNLFRWEWLDVLIKMTREHADVPVILYAPQSTLEKSFFQISADTHIFVANDLTVLKQKLKEIIVTEEKSKKIILFVDDDQNVLNAYTRILRKTPWEILTASNGKKALEIIQNQQIDLIVTDIKMPQLHGVELVSRIRQIHRNLPIVVCSAYHGMKTDADLQFHEVAAFLEKPVDPDVLESKLQELLS